MRNFVTRVWTSILSAAPVTAPVPSTARLTAALDYVHRRFDAHGIWHCLVYGTLLGAVRDGALIPWDYDFDLLVQPRDARRILALTADTVHDGFTFAPSIVTGNRLAVNPTGLAQCAAGAIEVRLFGEKIADLYTFTLFNDGVLRRLDVQHDAYWVPHSSFAHFFVERLDTARIGDHAYPVPQHAERFLADTYGDDWRVPYRAVQQGGAPRDGATVHSDRYEPHLTEQLAWCDAQGWDRRQYAHEYAWPRPIRAAGPIGPTVRTADSSRALWWRSAHELTSLY